MTSRSPLQIVAHTEEETTARPGARTLLPSTPFVALYGEAAEALDPVAEARTIFLNELYDEEFDEAVSGLVGEARALVDTRLRHEVGDPTAQGHAVERMLTAHFAPLAAEAEAMLGSVASGLAQRDASALTEAEIDALVDGHHGETVGPTFDRFLGKLKRAVKKVAKTAVKLVKKGVSVAAKLGLGPVLERLKALVRPLLRRVIGVAIGKLPSALQPHARKLASRLPFLQEVEDGDAVEPERPSEVAAIQLEFDEQVANVVFAPSEVEMESELARASNGHAAVDVYPVAELEVARESFVQGLTRLKEGEDPTPLVEQFLPAILPALRVGIRIVGRKRVVDILAKMLGRLIERFVGPQITPALSQAIVDAGLRLMQLETRPDDPREAASAVAATVEETVRHVAALPEYVLEDQELFEGFVLEAFERAAASNLPAILPESTYRQRPDLREARGLAGTWVMMPRGQRKRYKKYSRTVATRLTPHKVRGITTFQDVPIAEYLEEEMGVPPGEDVDVVAHLFEALPGTHASDIAAAEADTPGLGAPQAYRGLHPLTPQAAGLLLGEPDLGREVDASRLADPHTLEPGQRLFYLEVRGKRPLTAFGDDGRPRGRRPTEVRVTLDFAKDEIRVLLFLSEVRAQEVAVRLRQNRHVGAITARLHRLIERGLGRALAGTSGRLRIVHESVTPAAWATALRRLPANIPQRLHARLQAWVLEHLARHLKESGRQFVQAAEDTADGVTVTVVVRGPPGLAQLRRALRGGDASRLDLTGPAPNVTVETTPGHRHE